MTYTERVKEDGKKRILSNGGFELKLRRKERFSPLIDVLSYDTSWAGTRIRMPVTHRDLQRYSTRGGEWLRQFLDGAENVCEIGAGLGEFTPAVVQTGRRPIVIDPCNYPAAARLFREVLGTYELLEHERHVIEMLLERCRTLLDPTKVRRLPCKVSAVLSKAPELRGNLDRIVDNNGAYVHRDKDTDPIPIVRELLSPRGVYFLR